MNYKKRKMREIDKKILGMALFYKKSTKWLKTNHPETYERVMATERPQTEIKGKPYGKLGDRPQYYPHKDDAETVLDLSL